MNRYSTDRYRSPTRYDRYTSSLSRSKSPYRSTSSLNSHASNSSNLKVNTDNFDLLNKSLARHDSSFVLNKDDSLTGKSGSNRTNNYSNDHDDSNRYGSLKKDRFNVNRLNKDYSTNKFFGKSGADTSSSDYDQNNNYQFSGSYGKGGKGKSVSGCASSSESDYETSGQPLASYRYSSGRPYTSNVARSSLLTTDKGDHDHLSDRDGDPSESDESMSEYIHCKSFCPDSVSDSKLFVSFQSS